jgi:phenylalanyl-tRNA synthetase beta chain
MICDGEHGPVAIAGVMGGENSEIEDSTTDVLIESAHFSPISIRKTGKQLGLSTDASYRFERGVDPEGTVYCPEPCSCAYGGNSRRGNHRWNHRRIPGQMPIEPICLSTINTNRHLGTHLTAEEIANHLRSIEFKVSEKDSDSMDVRAPHSEWTWRARKISWKKWPDCPVITISTQRFPVFSAKTNPPLRSLELKNEIRELMAGFGFNETIHYSFTGENQERLEFPLDDMRRKELPILNPLSETLSVMRTTLDRSLLEGARKIFSGRSGTCNFLSLEKPFTVTGPEHLPQETGVLAAVWTGCKNTTDLA